MMIVITILYILTLCGLTIHLTRMVWLMLYAKLQHQAEPPVVATAELPSVTVQLPIYNEKLVVTRLIKAVCALDYPADRLQIQVLDDSTDHTTALIAQSVALWQQRGLNIVHLRRPDRRGHKAGNLAYGLPQATGEFIAIFDADFMPNPAWLRHAVAHFFQEGSDRLGLVQTRWDHSNTHQSLLTYAQMLTYDDFYFAQATRARLGLWSSFYGSAGLWRRACIEEAGGWLADTLTEDVDLAYRAQLAGWRMSYDGTILAWAELPNQMLAYKQQQFRWSKGNIQVSRKLSGQLLTASLTPLQKTDAILFATWPVIHGLLILLLLLKLPQLIWPTAVAIYLDSLVAIGLVSIIIPSLVDWAQGKNRLPLHWGLQVGVALTHTYGLLVGLFGQMGGEFRGTPKSGNSQQQNILQVAPDRTIIGELTLVLIVLLSVLFAIQQQQWLALPLLTLYLLGIGWVGGQSVWETVQWYIGHRNNV
jgi:cellulose synthase/poly-beta-1,6-N-acetylglucosamine synthase-like glycosyltransferase